MILFLKRCTKVKLSYQNTFFMTTLPPALCTLKISLSQNWRVKENPPQRKSQLRHFPDRRRKRRKIPYQNKYNKKRQENQAENNLNLPTATSTAAEHRRTTAPPNSPHHHHRTTQFFSADVFCSSARRFVCTIFALSCSRSLFQFSRIRQQQRWNINYILSKKSEKQKQISEKYSNFPLEMNK